MDAKQIISVGIVTTLVWSGMVGLNQILGKEVLVCPFELYIPLIRTAILKAPSTGTAGIPYYNYHLS